MFMKRNLLFSVLALLTACNSNPPASSTDSLAKPAADSVMSAMPAIQSPYPIEYSSKFAVDAPKNAETILTVWKDWENGNVAAHKELWADNIMMHFSDGTLLMASRDSIMAWGQQMRNSLSSSVSRVQAVTALKSVDSNQHWVLIWGFEKNTDKKGKVDSSYLQETWRFTDDGKIDRVYQFRAAAAPPKKKM
jgi:hypothetical protein